MLTIRKYEARDARAIDNIYKSNGKDYNYPDLRHTMAAAVVEHNGKIVAFGCLELIPEATLILDQSESDRTKVMSLDLLLHEGFATAKNIGFSHFIVMPDSEVYSNELKKHFGFEPYNALRKVVT